MKKLSLLLICIFLLSLSLISQSHAETPLKDSRAFLASYTWDNVAAKRTASNIYWMVPDMIRAKALAKFKTALDAKVTGSENGKVTVRMLKDTVREVAPTAKRVRYILRNMSVK